MSELQDKNDAIRAAVDERHADNGDAQRRAETARSGQPGLARAEAAAVPKPDPANVCQKCLGVDVGDLDENSVCPLCLAEADWSEDDRVEIADAGWHGTPTYAREINGEWVDVYQIADAFCLPAALSHALKKLLCCGRRGHKSRIEDLQEVIQSVERQLEMDGDE